MIHRERTEERARPVDEGQYSFKKSANVVIKVVEPIKVRVFGVMKGFPVHSPALV